MGNAIVTGTAQGGEIEVRPSDGVTLQVHDDGAGPAVGSPAGYGRARHELGRAATDVPDPLVRARRR